MQYRDHGKLNEDIITFETFEIIGKDMYAPLIDKNILARLSLDETRIDIVNTNDEYRFKKCICLNDNLFCADNMGEALVEYDIKNNTCKSYNMNTHIKEDNNVAAIESSGKYIFVVSQYKGTLYVFDSKNKKLDREEALERRVKELFGEQTECNIRCWKIDEFLYLMVNNGDNYYICKYNVLKRSFQELSKNIFHYSMRNAYCFESKLYILEDDFTLCIWDVKDNQTQRIDLVSLKQMISGSKLKYKYAFSMLAVTKKNIWLFPAGENDDIFVYDLLDKTTQKYDRYPVDFFYINRKGWSKYSEIKERKGTIYVAARLSNYCMIIDIQTGRESWKVIGSYDFSEYYHDLIIRGCEKKQAVYEQNIYLFNAFLKCHQKFAQNSTKYCNTGNKIWEVLR